MRCFALTLATVAAVATTSLPPVAFAAGQRSFVSTSGVDNPSCSITQPCRSFAAAITATNAGGEIIVVDSGGYGAMTIAKSLSIVAPAGIHAGITVTSGNGVTVLTPNAGDRVVLAGLVINAQGSAGDGISFNGRGVLEIARTRISGFPVAGIHFVPLSGGQGRMRVADTSVSANGNGILVEGGGAPGETARVALERVGASGNATGLTFWDYVTAAVTDSTITQNFPYGVSADTLAGKIALLSFDRCTVSGNGTGVDTSGAGTTYAILTATTVSNNEYAGLRPGSGTEMRIAGVTITQNTTGIQNGGGIVHSQGNNFFFGNTADGVSPIVVGSR